MHELRLHRFRVRCGGVLLSGTGRFQPCFSPASIGTCAAEPVTSKRLRAYRNSVYLDSS
jgi:hypothetical protein